MANYPTSIPSFTTKSAGDTIQASFFNSPQDEIVAIGTDLLAAWSDVPFNAGNFSANGSMTWTVAGGDVEYYKYKKVGKIAYVAFKLNTTTVGGTPSTELRIAIPYTPTGTFFCAVLASDNGAATEIAVGLTASTYLGVTLLDGTNWAAATNTTSLVGTIVYESTT